jgi:hypothetical protein
LRQGEQASFEELHRLANQIAESIDLHGSSQETAIEESCKLAVEAVLHDGITNDERLATFLSTILNVTQRRRNERRGADVAGISPQDLDSPVDCDLAGKDEGRSVSCAKRSKSESD